VIRSLITAATLALAAAFATPPAYAQSVEVAGVKYEETLQSGNTTLVLNGAGIRYKAIFKVYSAGLYLPKKASTPEAVLSMPGHKRISITMLRDINAAELGKLFTRGMEDNAPREEFSKSVSGTLKLSELFFRMKKLNAGDSFSVDWTPGVGTMIYINGKPSIEHIKEPEFFSALLKIWLGNSPADYALKEALLGIKAEPRGRNNG